MFGEDDCLKERGLPMDRKPQYHEFCTDVYPEWCDERSALAPPQPAPSLPVLEEDDGYGL